MENAPQPGALPNSAPSTTDQPTNQPPQPPPPPPPPQPQTTVNVVTPQKQGNYRFVAERRQYGGLLMLTGFCAIIQPLAHLAEGVGPDGPLVTSAGDSAYWQFVGSCCLFAIGIVTVLIGYLEAICDWGEITHTTLSIALTQTAFIYYVSDMAAVGHLMVDTPPRFFLVFNDDLHGLNNQAKVNESDEVYFIGSIGYVCV